MIVGVFRDHLPRVTLDLPARGQSLAVEFILDTGFDGYLAVPSRLLSRLEASPLYDTLRRLGDGSLVECPAYELELQWGDEIQTVEF